MCYNTSIQDWIQKTVDCFLVGADESGSSRTTFLLAKILLRFILLDGFRQENI